MLPLGTKIQLLAALLSFHMAMYSVNATGHFNTCYCGDLANIDDTKGREAQVNATDNACNKFTGVELSVRTTYDHFVGLVPTAKGDVCHNTEGHHAFTNGCFDCVCQQEEPKGQWHSTCTGKEHHVNSKDCPSGCQNGN